MQTLPSRSMCRCIVSLAAWCLVLSSTCSSKAPTMILATAFSPTSSSHFKSASVKSTRFTQKTQLHAIASTGQLNNINTLRGGAATAESTPPPQSTGATVPQLVFNLVKGIVGAGVLTLPSGIAAFGNAPSAVIPATVLVLLFGVMSGYGFGLIGRTCALTDTTSYRDAWSETVSPKTSWMPAMACTLQTISAILAYSMILAETGQSLALSAGYSVTKVATLSSITVALLLPLCLLKDLSSLAPFSLLGSLGMIYTTIAMAIRYLGKAYAVGGRFAKDVPAALRPSFGTVGASGVFRAQTTILIGMLSTAYMAHFNAPKFYEELNEPRTVNRYMKVVGSSFALSTLLFAAVAGLGFLTFGQATSGLILNNYATGDKLMSFSRIAVASSILLGYPLAFTGARDGILDLLNVKNRSNAKLNTLTFGLLGSITVLALIVPDVSFVLALGGASLGNALIYIFPGLMFRGAIRKVQKATNLQKTEVKIAMLAAVMGLGLGVMGSVQAIQSVL